MSAAAQNPRLLFKYIAGMLWIVAACANAQVSVESTGHEPVVQELISLLDSRDSLKRTLEAAVETSDMKGIQNLEELYIYLDDMVTWIPTERELVPKALKLLHRQPSARRPTQRGCAIQLLDEAFRPSMG